MGKNKHMLILEVITTSQEEHLSLIKDTALMD